MHGLFFLSQVVILIKKGIPHRTTFQYSSISVICNYRFTSLFQLDIINHWFLYGQTQAYKILLPKDIHSHLTKILNSKTFMIL